MATTRLISNMWRTSRYDLLKEFPCFFSSPECIWINSMTSTFPQVEGSELELLQRLHDSVYQQSQDWYQRLGDRMREQINKQYGIMPNIEENIQVGALVRNVNRHSLNNS